MSELLFCCHSCGEEQEYTALVRTPARFVLEGRIFDFPFPSEWICMECLQEQIDNLKHF